MLLADEIGKACMFFVPLVVLVINPHSFRYSGADPYLAGEAAYETILGIQSQGVQACAKHYIANEQEHNRTTESSNLDDKTVRSSLFGSFIVPSACNKLALTGCFRGPLGLIACNAVMALWVQMHEVYAHPFLRSVAANVASIMCSYSACRCFFSFAIHSLNPHQIRP